MMHQNCAQKNFQFSADSSSGEKPTSANGGNTLTPANAFGTCSGSSNLTQGEVDKLCPIIESIDHVAKAKQSSAVSAPVVINDLVISGAGQESLVLGNIIRLTIQLFAGEFVARAQNLLKLSEFAGEARIATQDTGPIDSFAGRICLSTNSVGNISSGAGELNIVGPTSEMGQGGDVTNRAGETYISNLKLGTISHIAGSLTFVGGSIQSLLGGAGIVVLDNVQVDSIDGTGFSGSIILKNGTSVKSLHGGHIIQQ
jgi:hypothetical protein